MVARDAEQCYSALPVDLFHEDKTFYYQQRGIHNASSDQDHFFIEPHTHRLTTVGIRAPCVSPFAPLYRAQAGHWLRVNPSISLASTPRQLMDAALEGRGIKAAHTFDWEKGGIYPISEVFDMEKMRQNPRV